MIVSSGAMSHSEESLQIDYMMHMHSHIASAASSFGVLATRACDVQALSVVATWIWRGR